MERTRSEDEGVIPYASALPNKECLAELDKYFGGWRFLLSPASVPSVTSSNRHLLYERGYAIDNGVYADWSKDRPFNEDRFLDLLDRYASDADWIVIPDAVGDWETTIGLFMIWVSRLFRYHTPLMIVAQDGCQENNYRELRGVTRNGHRMIKGGVGVFVGGSTEWKLTHAPKIAKICRENGALCHVGRVNSAKRARMCWNWGATSFDGSGMSRFTKTARYVSSEMASLHKGQEIQPQLF